MFRFRRSAKNNLPKKRRIPGVLSDRDRKRQEREEKRAKAAADQEAAPQEDHYKQLLGIFNDKEDDGLSTSDEEDSEVSDAREDGEAAEEEPEDEAASESDGDDEAVGHQEEDTPFRRQFACNYDDKWFQTASTEKHGSASGHLDRLGSFQLTNRSSVFPAFDLSCRSIKNMHLKKVLETHAAYELSSCDERSKWLRLELLSVISQYSDVMHLRRRLEDIADCRWSYCLHVLNHLLNVRQQVLRNNARLAKARLEKQELEDVEARDQGFTRARVLVLLPFRESAKQVVQTLASLLFGPQHDGQTTQMRRFLTEFSSNKELRDPLNKKPADFLQTFAGNTDDSFRIGLAITKKSLKLFTDFYDSDVILCSPLALRMMISSDQPDYDFLTSIELLIIDQIDVAFMQNWEHVVEILKHVNQKPVSSTDIDFSRVRMHFLDEKAAYFRQTVFLSSAAFNEAVALFNKSSLSLAGRLVFSFDVSLPDASVSHVFVKLPQSFVRLDCSSLASCADSRFEFFTRTVLPDVRNEAHVLIYVSSYFDFVRLRNFMKREEYSFVSLCEYTDDGKVAQGRSQFFKEGRRLMLYTERFHFYRRFQVKGIRKILFYQLPTIPQFYHQICNLAIPALQGKRFTDEDEKRMSVSAYFCKFDAHRLRGVLGSEKASRLLTRNAPSNVTFCSE